MKPESHADKLAVTMLVAAAVMVAALLAIFHHFGFNHESQPIPANEAVTEWNTRELEFYRENERTKLKSVTLTGNELTVYFFADRCDYFVAYWFTDGDNQVSGNPQLTTNRCLLGNGVLVLTVEPHWELIEFTQIGSGGAAAISQRIDLDALKSGHQSKN